MKFKVFILFIIFFCFYLPAAEKLVIISPHWEGVKIEISNAFKKWYLKKYGEKVEIEWIDQGGTSDDLKFVESLYKKNPEGIGIDLFFGGGVSPYIRLKKLGYLKRYRVPYRILKKIPKKCAGIPNYDRSYYWYGVVLSGFGILYNKKVLNYFSLPVAETWEDLGKKEYFSLVGAADPRHSGSMHMMYEIILQAYGWKKGWEIILSLSGNTKAFSSSASQVAKDTTIGEVAVSLCIDSYALAQIEMNGEENMGFILPENLTVINPDAIGILKGAPHIETAKKFINFLLSYQGQLIWMLKKGVKYGPDKYSLNRFSILPEVYKNPDIKFKSINPYKVGKTIKYNFILATKRWNVLNDMIGCFAVDCHPYLKKAWEIVKDTENVHLKRRFFEIPVEEKEQKLLWRNWSNSVFRNRYINEWLNFSIEKYKGIIKEKRIYNYE